ncbi:MAG TPA: hypothetical protein DCW51_07340 [Clostridium sp.]|nr:hypothetical protein [Clostridium sp.]
MTTYDEIWECFLTNTKVNKSLIPTNEAIIYQWINNAKNLYNNKIKQYQNDFSYPVECNNDLEMLNMTLTNDELLIFANYIRLVFLKNEKTAFVSKYGVFQKEFGINNYNAQANAKDLEVKEQEAFINELIINALDDWSVY